MIPHNTMSVFRFEFRRTVTPARMSAWLLLVFFPIFIVSVMKYYESGFQGGTIGMRERPMTLIDQGITIEFRFRNGRREAKITQNGTVLPAVPIPNDMSRAEIGRSIQQIIDDYEEPTPGQQSTQAIDDFVWGWVLLGLIPGVITLLGLLLWATPVVQAELEGRTWIYLAVRPRGRASVLFGKYLTAVSWTALAGWTSLTVCVLIAQPEYAVRLWSTMFLLIGCACLGYGAIFCLLGVVIPRRAMVIAVAYVLIFEFLISFVPAVINQFTVLYRLRNLLVLLMDWRAMFNKEAGEAFLGDQPAWVHITFLTLFIAVLLTVAMQVIQRKEYVSAEDV